MDDEHLSKALLYLTLSGPAFDNYVKSRRLCVSPFFVSFKVFSLGHIPFHVFCITMTLGCSVRGSTYIKMKPTKIDITSLLNIANKGDNTCGYLLT